MCVVLCGSALQSKRKAMADPLNDMMRYVKAKKKQSEDDKKATPVSGNLASNQ